MPNTDPMHDTSNNGTLDPYGVDSTTPRTAPSENNKPAPNPSIMNSTAPYVPVTGTNIDPFLTLFASVLTSAGGILAAKGYISSQDIPMYIGFILSLVAGAYMIYKQTTDAKLTSLAKTLDVPKASLARHVVALKHINRKYK